MKRTEVKSSNLKSVGFDPETNTLELEFNHGGVYRYFNVPPNKFHDLMAAESLGKYFDSEIKKAGYRYEKVN